MKKKSDIWLEEMRRERGWGGGRGRGHGWMDK